MAKEKKYRGIKVRGNSLHFEFANALGDMERGPSGFAVGQEKAAAAALAVLKREALAKRKLLKKMALGEGGIKSLPKDGVNIEMFWDAWVNDRFADVKTKKAAKENLWQGRDYIKPLVGKMKLLDFRADPDAEAFVKALKALKDEGGRPRLGSRTIRNLFYALHSMFEAARIPGFVPGNPCVVKDGVLPKPRDKNPNWRRDAIYERDEIEQLISSPRVEFRHRMLYGLLFLAGLRPQDASAIQLSDIDMGGKWKPLGLLEINKAWCSKEHRVKGVKGAAEVGDKKRLIPIHPTLASLLAQWKLTGWEEYMGRKPGPVDLLVPSSIKGTHLSNKRILLWMHEDLELLSLRRRRAYDSRRSFVTMCTETDIPRDIYKLWVWGEENEVPDLYTSVRWGPHCREMVKLEISLREREVARVSAIAGTKLHSELHRHGASDDNTMNSLPNLASIKARSTGLEAVLCIQSEATLGNNSAEPLGLAPSANHPDPRESLQNVQLCSFDWQSVSANLGSALKQWDASHDVDELRHSLTALLRLVDGGGQ